MLASGAAISARKACFSIEFQEASNLNKSFADSVALGDS
jgi:hypothetical protein